LAIPIRLSIADRPQAAAIRCPRAWDKSLNKPYWEVIMRGISIAHLLGVLLATFSVTASAQSVKDTKYPPMREYMMELPAEVALAKSAAPESISGRAAIMVLKASGYETVDRGDSGFVCMVLRGWAAPTYSPAPLRELVYDAKLRAPICFDPVAARTVLPYQELRARLAMAGKGPDEIAAGVGSAYAKGELPKMETVAFAYMYSADMYLGPQVGHFHPHMMIYAPYYTNAMLGGNSRESMLPRTSDDEGTPFTVIVIPVDGRFAIKSKLPTK
jgi:hypothetical protein